MIDHVPRLKPYGRSATGDLAFARSLYDAGRLHDAIWVLDRALRENPELAEAHCLRGIVTANLRRWDEATRALELALKLRPDDAASCSALAEVSLETGQLTRALDCVERSIAADGRSRDFLLRARILRAMRRFAAARASCRLAIELDPQSTAAHCELGELLLQQLDFQGAISHFEIARHLHPARAATFLALGDCLRLAGDPARAAEEYKAAARLSPADPEPQLRLARLFVDQNRLDQALAALRLASVMAPHSAECLLLLARVYLSLKRYEEAIDYARRAENLDPRIDSAAEVVQSAEAAMATASTQHAVGWSE